LYREKDMDLISVFACRYPVFLITFVEKVVFSPSYVFGAFVKNQVGIATDSYLRLLCCSTGLHGCFCIRRVNVVVI
jgi:hypothetical protein